MTPHDRTPGKPVDPGDGLQDVTRSVRVLARRSRDLLTDAGEVLERELLMAVSVSERLRDEAISEELLADARALRLHSGLRDTAHRTIDLVADAVGVAAVTAVRFGESLADQPRAALPEEAERADPVVAERTAAASA